ncbi:iron complex transport system substrate-binding protein [Pseudonocardia thermophila]|jgi:ABC-type Fe3+-hydroxamate transport system, periplasmic component|uniref:Iron complex transport system substrate-binding protein n=1 Tax=Pseudonocardia thermophila TaxID=1848 RepID=A0A1M7B1A4_PSETH|nr:ABC transporter substrate-binding protein [Pseudonocardia thermophila]SHL48770.1 iron complex transport system substrate-binding protein [Pseudonocardia thermophila]
MRLNRTSRRLAALVAGLLGVALALAGCGGGSQAVDAAPAADAPVTITTAYGDTTVNAKPQRIVALAARHVELLNLLGEKPVAWADYTTTAEEVPQYYPWMVGTYSTDPDPNLFTADYVPAPEAIAALQPDLILTTIWQTDEQMYQQLSQIAPTYVGIEKDTNTSWQDDLAALAKLTRNDPSIVQKTQAEYDAAFKAAAEKLTQLKDKTFYIAALGEGEQLWLTEYAAAPLMALGLKPGPGQPMSGAEAADAPKYSLENVDKLTADVVLVATEHRDPNGSFKAAMQADPRVAALPAAQHNALIYLDSTQWGAVNGGSAASEIWWLNQIMPTLEKITP